MTKYLSVTIAALLLAPANAESQIGSAAIDPSACRAAATRAPSGNSEHNRMHAMRVLMSCRDIAPEVLIQLWANPQLSTDGLTILFELSRRNRTQTLYDQLIQSVRNHALTSETRVAALGALAAFLEPGLGMHLEFRSLTGLEPLLWDNIWARGITAEEGMSISVDQKARIHAVVDDLVSDADSKVSSAAWWLQQILITQDEN